MGIPRRDVIAVATLRIAPTSDLSSSELDELRSLLEEAFQDADEGGLTDEDWEHTLGGLHVIAMDDAMASHAAVVPRVLRASGRSLQTGYVEAVATAVAHRGRGFASQVMGEAAKIIRQHHELGALATGIPDFYARLGWDLWQGPTFADSPEGRVRTPEEDGAVMILRTGVTEELEATGPLTCDWRAGDVW